MKKNFTIEVSFKDGSRCVYNTSTKPYYEHINKKFYLMIDDGNWKTRLRDSEILIWKCYSTQ